MSAPGRRGFESGEGAAVPTAREVKDTPKEAAATVRALSIEDVRAFYQRFVDVQGAELAAALAYRLAAGLFPFLIFAVGISAAALQLVGGDEPATTAIDRLDTVLSGSMADALEPRLAQLAETQPVVPILGGFAATLWTATLGGLSIMRNLNVIHGQDETRSRWTRVAIALGIGAIAGLGAIAAFLVLMIGSMNPRGIAEGLGLPGNVGLFIGFLRWPLAFIILAGSVAVIYHLAPTRNGRLPEISLGALVFAVAWTIASGAFVFFLQTAGTFAATYGTLTGFVAMLIWVYFASLAFVIGAVIDAELESRNG